MLSLWKAACFLCWSPAGIISSVYGLSQSVGKEPTEITIPSAVQAVGGVGSEGTHSLIF